MILSGVNDSANERLSPLVNALKKFILLSAISTFIVGCSSNSGQFVDSGSLLLAEPEPISQRIQMVIARYTHILYRADLETAERAELLFQRGNAYDAIGLKSLAVIDYNEAVRLKPDLAEAHNSIGVHHIQTGNFLQAYESFDATLEINPDYNFALLNRGVALYYGGRSTLAATDTKAFWTLEKSDPYRLLWLYITEAKNDPIAALQALGERKQYVTDDTWASVLIEFYLDEVNETKVIAKLLENVTSQTELNNRLCEAYFYIGKYHLARGNNFIARNYFKLSLSTNVHEFVEHKYSRVELGNLRRQQLQ
ncbi:MAG: lipoprotein NlpI [Pseudomonadota bacterium]